ncbi:MAG: group III truncated hemoglobin [Hyphomicrobiaceae bacterium]
MQKDPRLGPIFTREIDGNWTPHLEKMKSFWRSVLLKTREYDGRPVPAHANIKGVTTDDFRTWLTLFEKTADEILDPEAVPLAVVAAQRIASSLWLSMNISENPFDAPPKWSSKTS